LGQDRPQRASGGIRHDGGDTVSRAASARGQPLVALTLLLGGWAAFRVAAWEISAPASFAHGLPGFPLAAQREELPSAPGLALARKDAGLSSPNVAAISGRVVEAALPGFPAPPPPPRLLPRPAPVIGRALQPVPVNLSAHRMLWMAALADLPLPTGLQALAVASDPEASHRPPRWSADGWLLLRRGGAVTATIGGLAPASYGASQLGGVVRYRLVPQSAHRPELYLRGSAALDGSREHEVAFGFSLRPIAALPVVIAAEARINMQPGATRARPAAFAYTELPPLALPLGVRAEVYGQAGYVGGNFASAFADGQLRVDRRLLASGRSDLRIGAGGWAGAQRGASRVDVGPTATIGLPIGGTASARLALDWRFRVAGNAVPASGPAMTLSAGF